jgi:CRP/FNR family cyclic AMP-dependent transcriptional regulator
MRRFCPDLARFLPQDLGIRERSCKLGVWLPAGSAAPFFLGKGRMEFLDVFKKNYLVAGLQDGAIEEIAALAEYKVHLPREDILRMGDPGSDLIVVLDGRVNVVSEKGEKLAEVGPGSVLGEVALLDNRPRSANAVALGRVQAAYIPASKLRKYLGGKREVGFVVLTNLCQVLCHRLRETDQRVDVLSEKASTKDPWKLAT